MSISKPLRLILTALAIALLASVLPSSAIAAQSAATPDDVDGDGIPNLVDPDSDGDGILDVDEFGPCSTGGNIVYNHNDTSVELDNGGQGQFATFEFGADAYVANTTDLSFGPGISEPFDQSHTYIFDDADAPNFAAAQLSEDYVQISFTPDTDLLLNAIGYGFFTSGPSDSGFGLGDFEMASTFASNADFRDEAVLQQDIQVPSLSPPSEGAFEYAMPGAAIGSEVLVAGTEYFFRFYLYNPMNSDPQQRVRFDDLYIEVNPLGSCFLDTDGDGIYDHLDSALPPTCLLYTSDAADE